MPSPPIKDSWVRLHIFHRLMQTHTCFTRDDNTKVEIRAKISSLGSDKVSGPDDFQYEVRLALLTNALEGFSCDLLCSLWWQHWYPGSIQLLLPSPLRPLKLAPLHTSNLLASLMWSSKILPRIWPIASTQPNLLSPKGDPSWIEFPLHNWLFLRVYKLQHCWVAFLLMLDFTKAFDTLD